MKRIFLRSQSQHLQKSVASSCIVNSADNINQIGLNSIGVECFNFYPSINNIFRCSNPVNKSFSNVCLGERLKGQNSLSSNPQISPQYSFQDEKTISTVSNGFPSSFHDGDSKRYANRSLTSNVSFNCSSQHNKIDAPSTAKHLKVGYCSSLRVTTSHGILRNRYGLIYFGPQRHAIANLLSCPTQLKLKHNLALNLFTTANHYSSESSSSTTSTSNLQQDVKSVNLAQRVKRTELHWMLMKYNELMELTEADREFREKILKFIKKCTMRAFSSERSNIKVMPFGSYVSGLATRFNDLDVVIVGLAKPNATTGGYVMKQRLRVATLLSEVRQLIEDESALHDFRISNVTMIPRARIPLLKFEIRSKESKAGHNKSRAPKVWVDICMSDSSGPTAATYMSYLKDSLPALRPLVIATKALLKGSNLNEVNSGGISSFALTNLVIAHIQEEFKRGQSTNDVGFLFVSFLERYGFSFDPAVSAIAVDRGGIINRPDLINCTINPFSLRNGKHKISDNKDSPFLVRGIGESIGHEFTSKENVREESRNEMNVMALNEEGWGEMSSGHQHKPMASMSFPKLNDNGKAKQGKGRSKENGIGNSGYDVGDGDNDDEEGEEEEEEEEEYEPIDTWRARQKMNQQLIAHRGALYVECPLSGRNISVGTYRMAEVANLFRIALRKIEPNMLRCTEDPGSMPSKESANAQLMTADECKDFQTQAQNNAKRVNTLLFNDRKIAEQDFFSVLFSLKKGEAHKDVAVYNREVLEDTQEEDFYDDLAHLQAVSRLSSRVKVNSPQLTTIKSGNKEIHSDSSRRSNDRSKKHSGSKSKNDHDFFSDDELLHKKTSFGKNKHSPDIHYFIKNEREGKNQLKSTKDNNSFVDKKESRDKRFIRNDSDYDEWKHSQNKRNSNRHRLNR